MLIRIYLIPFAKQFVRTLNVNIIYYLFRNEKRAASYDSFQGRYSAAAAIVLSISFRSLTIYLGNVRAFYKELLTTLN